MSALDRARGLFIAPPPASGAATGDSFGGWQPPTASEQIRSAHAGSPVASAHALVADAGRTVAAPPGARTHAAGAGNAAPLAADAVAVASAAVLGRPGEVEPVAAALALALRRETRSKAATVVVVGAMPGEEASGGAAARRLAARLEAHGLEARVRGRLAWARLDPEDPQFVVAVRRATLVAAPAVLAITAPRTAAIDQALAEQDLLVIVTADPEGPLARLVAAGLGETPLTTLRPLGRGPARSLARAGVRAPRVMRHLLARAGL